MVENFHLPMALGLFRSESDNDNENGVMTYDPYQDDYSWDDNMDPEEIGFIPEQEVHTDLQQVFEWRDFDDWVGRKLETIQDPSFWELEFANIIPPDFVINIANQADLDDAITDILFKITLFILDLVGLRGYQFIDPYLSDVGVGEFDFCFVHISKNSVSSNSRHRHHKIDRPLFIVQTLSPWDSPDLEDPNTLDANYLQQMYGYLMFNHDSFGVVTSYTHTRFVRLIGPGRMLVSEPYSWNRKTGHTVVGCLVALAIHCSGNGCESPTTDTQHDSIKSSFFLSKPNQFLPIFKRRLGAGNDGKFTGSVRWEIDSLRKKLNNGYFIAKGEFCKQRTPSLINPVIIKCFDKQHCNSYQLHLLSWETEMYSRVQNYQGTLFPKHLTYGSIWDMLSVIVLEDVGQPLTPSLLRKVPNLGYKMLAPVKILHKLNLIHGDICLKNFVVDSNMNIKLVSLGQCVYTGATRAKIEELYAVRKLIRQGVHAYYASLSSPPGTGQKLWRQFKSRYFKAGWQKYKQSYSKIRRGPFIIAVKNS